MKNHIKSFHVDGVHLPWSNFYVSPFMAPHFSFSGPGIVEWQSGEHYYQAAKGARVETAEFIRNAKTPGAAKRLGREAVLRSDWEEIKIEVMRRALGHKFAPGTQLADELLATGHSMMTEGNTWNDTVWGVCKGEGQNWLGWLLLAQREYLRCEMQGQQTLL